MGINFLRDLLESSLNILNGSSVWLIISFLLAGFLHELLKPEKFQQILGNTKLGSLIKSTISGMLLPICSCGVIPLGISMYYSGAYLGPTLAFMVAAPIINPVAVILSYGLLGKEITIIYVITGLVSPTIVGVIANKFGGNEIKAPGIDEDIKRRILIAENKTIIQRISIGMKWAFNDLAIVVSKYVVLGMIMAALIFSVVPKDAIQQYLGDPSIMSLQGIIILGLVMYVCAVGHIPFIAALLASGAAPGVAITFLMAGVGTNLPEFISMYKLMGKRAAIIYSSTIIIISLIVGYITNKLLMPGFKPVLSYDGVNKSITTANKLTLTAPMWVKYLCSFIIIVFACKALYQSVKGFVNKRRSLS